MLVIDCSITMAWLFEDERNDFPESVLEMLKNDTAIVPWIWTLEVANVLLVGERRNRITAVESRRFVKTLGKLPIEVEEKAAWFHGEESSLMVLARKYGLSAYDAAYLDLASRLKIPFATQDKPLIIAAKKAGVELVK